MGAHLGVANWQTYIKIREIKDHDGNESSYFFQTLVDHDYTTNFLDFYEPMESPRSARPAKYACLFLNAACEALMIDQAQICKGIHLEFCHQYPDKTRRKRDDTRLTFQLRFSSQSGHQVVLRPQTIREISCCHSCNRQCSCPSL